MKDKVIAAFDFDGTILSIDSFPDFLIHTFGKASFLKHLPFIILMKLAALTGLLSAHRAKEAVFSSFTKGMHVDNYNKSCQSYAQKITKAIYPSALEEIRKHIKAGHQVVIVSASVSDWIRPWAESVGIHQLVATEVEIKDGILTGHFSVPNCKGPEKVKRLRALFPDLDRYTLYAYGDSSGDKELLALADYPHYKHFK